MAALIVLAPVAGVAAARPVPGGPGDALPDEGSRAPPAGNATPPAALALLEDATENPRVLSHLLEEAPLPVAPSDGNRLRAMAGGTADDPTLPGRDPIEPIPTDPERLPHPDIRIVGDSGPQGFVLAHDPATGQPAYRPGSGVVAGSGTAEDPYVIAGWDVDVIILRNTTAHVVVRDNRIGAAEAEVPDDRFGVQLTAAENVTLAGNDVAPGGTFPEGYDPAVRIDRSAEVAVTGNRIRSSDGGVAVDGSRDVEIRDNGIGLFEYGIPIDVEDSARVRIESNEIEARYLGIVADGGDGLHVAGNDVHIGGYGVYVSGTSSAEVVRNRIDGRPYVGISIYGTPGARVVDNRVDAPDGIGVEIDLADRVELSDNHLVGPYGAITYGADDLDARANALVSEHAPGHGLVLYGSEDARLRDNRFHGSGLEVHGYGIDEFDHDVDASNRAHGGPIRYLVGPANGSIPRPAGQVFLVDADGRQIEGLSFEEVPVGLVVASTDGATVANVTGDRVGDTVQIVASTDVAVRSVTVDEGSAVSAVDGGGHAIADVEATRARTGIELLHARSNLVRDSIVRGDGAGILLWASEDNRIARNAMIGTGLTIRGYQPEDYRQSLDGNNTVNDEPIRYVFGEDDVRVTEDAGQVIVADARGVVVQDLAIGRTSVGVTVAFAQGVEVRDVAAEAGTGFVIHRVTDARLSELRAKGGSTGLFVHDADGLSAHWISTDGTSLGMAVADSPGARVRHLRVRDAGSTGLYVDDVPDLTLSDASVEAGFRGVLIDDAAGSYVRDLEVQVRDDGWAEAVDLYDAPGSHLSDVDAVGGSVDVAFSADVRLFDVEVEDARKGIVVDYSPGASVYRSTIRDVEETGVEIYGDGGSYEIRDTTIESVHGDLFEEPVISGVGIDVYDAAVEVRDAIVRDSGIGIYQVGSLIGGGSMIRNSHVVDNGIGVLVLGNGVMDAIHNWWGCPEGPNTPRCDAAVGSVAYAPWRTSPNPGAGA